MNLCFNSILSIYCIIYYYNPAIYLCFNLLANPCNLVGFISERNTSEICKKNAKQYQQPLRVTKFHTSASGYAKVLKFSLSARPHKVIYQSINDRAHWYALLLRLSCYPLLCLCAYPPAYRHSLFAESFAPCALAFTAPSVFIVFHSFTRLIVSPFCAVCWLDYIALAIILFSCVLANVALLHIKYKVVASPTLHKIKFLLHIPNF